MIGALERGDKTTRVESFVDASFAFALTLLVIAGDHIPGSVAELVVAVKGLPAYAASFLLVMKVWTGHVDWSRTYGLDDAVTRRLSLLLVFLVLIFMYPVKMVFSVLFSALTQDWLPARFTVTGLHELPVLFVTYGVAFGSLGVVMALLYRHAWRQRDALGLSASERIMTRARMLNWALVAAIAVVSIASTLLIPARAQSGWWLGFPGFVYFSLNLIAPLTLRAARRQMARVAAA